MKKSKLINIISSTMLLIVIISTALTVSAQTGINAPGGITPRPVVMRVHHTMQSDWVTVLGFARNSWNNQGFGNLFDKNNFPLHVTLGYGFVNGYNDITLWNRGVNSYIMQVNIVSRGVVNGKSTIFEIDMDINTSHNWFVDRTLTKPVPTDAVDFHTATIHELGHVLGLYHNTNTQRVSPMFGALRFGESRRNIHSDDKTALGKIY